MKNLTVTGLALAATLSLGTAHAQTVGQDLHDAGHDTAHATKTVAHKTAHGTRVAATGGRNCTAVFRLRGAGFCRSNEFSDGSAPAG